MSLPAIIVFMIFPAYVRAVSPTRIGDLHTSTAYILPLVSMEEGVVHLLEEFVSKENERLSLINSYIKEWRSTDPSSYVENPLASYHFFRRLVHDFGPVKDAISGINSDEVLESLNALRSSQAQLPNESDVNGVAWALVHLQDVYNLTMDTFIKGHIKNAPKVKDLSVEDCFRFGEESFKNLAFELSDLWTAKGIEILREESPLSKQAQERLEQSEGLILKRNMMRELVTVMAQKTDQKVYGQFSGLGVPKSFEKDVYSNPEQSKQVELLDVVYKKLCRGDSMQSQTKPEDLYCHLSYGVPSRQSFVPSKVERLSAEPEIAIYHDVLTENEIRQIQQLSFPILKTAQVKPYANISNMKSIARIGKSAWLHRSNYSLVERLFERIEKMTGLSAKYADDIHVLNYGVGGHYELHIDFFDFGNRIQTQNASEYRGDQVATLLFYLNDVTFGGSTVFPYLNVEVKPERGSVLVWYNLHRNGKGNYKTIHASCPVLLGQKWIATLWLNERGHEFTRPCLLDESR